MNPVQDRHVRSAWEAKDLQKALGLAQDCRQTALAWAWQTRIHLDAQDEDAALAAFRQIFPSPGAVADNQTPPGLLNLYGSFRGDSRSSAQAALMEAVASAELTVNSEEMHQLLAAIPTKVWPNSYLARQLSSNDLTHLRQWIAEGKRRIQDTHNPELARAVTRAALRVARSVESTRTRKQSERAHAIFRVAVHVSPARPRPPCHLGGPSPTLEPIDYVTLVEWVARRMLPFAADLQHAEATLDGIEHLETVVWKTVKKTLAGSNGQPVSALAALALISRGTTHQHMSDSVFQKLRRTADICMREALPLVMIALERQVPKDDPEPAILFGSHAREFLSDLDAELLRLECAGQLYKHLTHSDEAWRSLRVLYRGENERGHVECFLYQAQNTHGMLIQLGGEWSHLLGTREELLASMPETYFEDAALAVLS